MEVKTFVSSPLFPTYKMEEVAGSVKWMLDQVSITVGLTYSTEDHDGRGGAWRFYFWDAKTDLDYIPEFSEYDVQEDSHSVADWADKVGLDALEAFERGGDHFLYGK